VKDWPPVIAGVIALIGIWATISRARATFEHGRVEARKDRQRDLVADLIATGRALMDMQHIAFIAMAKMRTNDFIEWANTDSVAKQGELTQEMRKLMVRGLTEVADSRLRPYIVDISTQIESLSEDPAGDLIDTSHSDAVRFEALRVQLGRLRVIEKTLSEFQAVAIERLPVEIDTPPSPLGLLARRVWNSLRGLPGIR
jgi:hypothetical protein